MHLDSYVAISCEGYTSTAETMMIRNNNRWCTAQNDKTYSYMHNSKIIIRTDEVRLGVV